LLSVWQNLFRALCRLRQTATEPRTLWIDALCINHSDVSERENQVKLMRDIYTRTRNCIIWLGEFYELLVDWIDADGLEYVTGFPIELAANDEPTIFNGDSRDDFVLKGALDKCHVTENFAPSSWDGWRGRERYWPYLGAFCLLRSMAQEGQHLRDLEIYKLLGSGKVLDRILEKMMNIVSSPWWVRIWTVQEARVPPRAAVMLGSVSMPFGTILLACDRLRQHVHVDECCADFVTGLQRLETQWLRSSQIVTVAELGDFMTEYRASGRTVPRQ